MAPGSWAAGLGTKRWRLGGACVQRGRRGAHTQRRRAYQQRYRQAAVLRLHLRRLHRGAPVGQARALAVVARKLAAAQHARAAAAAAAASQDKLVCGRGACLGG